MKFLNSHRAGHVYSKGRLRNILYISPCTLSKQERRGIWRFLVSSKILKTYCQCLLWVQESLRQLKICMDIQARFSAVLKVSKVMKWSRIFVRSIRGLPNFRAIPIMNPLMRVHD